MKVLILSCSTGGGHNAAAYALLEQLEKEGHSAVVMDHLNLVGEKVSKEVGALYVNTVKTAPLVFGGAYQLGMMVSRHAKRSPVYYANGLVASHLERYLKEHSFDAILMPHLFPAETITYLKRKGVELPLTIYVATDYTCIPFSEETDCDYYILPHYGLVGEYVQRGVSREKLIPLGIPVSGKFHRKISQEQARLRLRLQDIDRLYLVAGGSMGAGAMAKLTATLHKQCKKRDGMVLICGNNQSLYHKLKKRYGNNPRIRVVPRTKHMSLYMKASDVIFTKPGGLTSTEAAVAGIPIVHTKPIPGCETVNRDFFVSHGMSVSSLTVKKQVEEGVKLASEKYARDQMELAQKRGSYAYAARNIVAFIHNKLESNNKSDSGEYYENKNISL